MSKNYFNKFEFIQAVNCSETNPYEATKKFEDYLSKYPIDYSAYTYFINHLITIGEYPKAEKLIAKLEGMYTNNYDYNLKSNKLKILKKRILFNKAKLLSHQERYDELLDLLSMYPDEMKEIDCFIEVYLKKKKNQLDVKRNVTATYLLRQIVEYDEEDFIDHIKKHLADYNQNDESISTSYFNAKFPIYEVINEIKKYIPSEKKLGHGLYQDTYVFKYNECGRDKNRLVDYFKVITFQNTNELITICPSNYCENLPFIDLNYLNKEENDIKVKKISQIEKFNKRYNIK